MKIKGFGGIDFSPVALANVGSRLLLNRAGRKLRKSLEALPTGSAVLDLATGARGVSRNTISLIGGASVERNRALALSMVAAVAKAGGRVVVVEPTDLIWRGAKRHGDIDLERVAFVRSKDPLDAIKAARAIVGTGKLDLVVVGPVGRSAGTSLDWMRDHAAQLKIELDGLRETVKGSDTGVVVMRDATGEGKRPSGPVGQVRKWLLDSAHLDFRTKRLATAGAAADPVVAGGRFTVDVSDASGGEKEQVRLELRPGGSVSAEGELLDYAMEEGVVTRSGSMYRTTTGVSLGRSRSDVKDRLGSDVGMRTLVDAARSAGGVTAAERYIDLIASRPTGPSRGDVVEVLHEQQDPKEKKGTAEKKRPKKRGMRRSTGSRGIRGGSGSASRGSAASRGRGGRKPGAGSTSGGSGRGSGSGSPKKRTRTVKSARHQRFLNAWFEGEPPPERDELVPLVVGERYRFAFQIAQRKTTKPGGSATKFIEPDFGHHHGLDLVVHLYSRDFEIEQRLHRLWLGRTDDTEIDGTWVVPLQAGRTSIRLVVSLANELEILQAVRFEVDVVESPVTARVG